MRLLPLVPCLAAAVLLAAPTSSPALERPTAEELRQYRADGSLPERIRRARALGNHRVRPDVAAHAAHRFALARSKAGLVGGQAAPPPAWQGMPTKGNVRVFALLVAFADRPPVNTPGSIGARLFGDGDGGYPYESLRNYYRRSSHGTLELGGATLGWYTTPYPRSEVVDNESLIREALASFDAGHDFSQYDNDGDGAIDYFLVIWTGPDNGWGNFWWAYQSRFRDDEFRIDGKALRDYSWQWESRSGTEPFSPNYAIHETGHALGLPDYYDYSPSIGPPGGLGRIDMMDGTWGDHNCFSKFLLDWLSPQVVSGGTTAVSLRPSAIAADAVLFAHGATSQAFSEYFMVQNRTRGENDTDLPGDGLLIWHVDARLNASGTTFEYDNSYTAHKLLRLMEADGLEQIEKGSSDADTGDYYVGPSTFSHWTRPGSARYDGSPSFVQVVDVSAAGDPMTLRLDEVFDATAPLGAPTTPTDEGPTTSRDVVEFRWTAGDAGDPDTGIAGYQLQVGTQPGSANVFDGIVGGYTFAVADIEEGPTYFARVRALNGAGVPGSWSGVSDGVAASWPAFPCAALDNCSLSFKTSGDAPWEMQEEHAEHGPSAARSGVVAAGQTSSLRAVATGPGWLDFTYGVRSDGCCSEVDVTVGKARYLSTGPVNDGVLHWLGAGVWVPPGRQVRLSFTTTAPAGAGAGFADHFQWQAETTDGAISGTVTDAGTSLGLRGVGVYVYSSDGSLVDWAHTDTYGRYGFGLSPGSYWAVAAAADDHVVEMYDDVPCPDWDCAFADGTPIVVTAGGVTSGVDFALSTGGRIAGTVRAASTGAPVPEVFVWILDPAGGQVTGSWADDAGGYVVGYLPPGTYHVRTSNYSGFIDELYGDVACPGGTCSVSAGTPIVVGAGATTSGVDFALTRGGRIAGRITSASDGASIAGAYVAIYDDSGVHLGWSDPTDSGGQYRLGTGLPSGSYRARTSNESLFIDELYDDIPCPRGGCSVSAGTPIVVAAGVTTSGVDFALSQGGAIEGRVTSAATGGGVPNAYVRIFGSAGIPVASSTYADAAGDYQVSGLLPGTYYAMSDNDQGLIDELYDDIPCPAGSCSATSGTPIVVVAGATTSGVDFALGRGGQIAGRITSASDGASIAGAIVAIYDDSGVHLGWSDPTDSGGRYRLGTGLPSGAYRARTSNESLFIDELYDDIPCPRGGCSVSAGTPIVVAAGVTTSGVDFALSQGGAIEGRVTSAATGGGVPNAYVRIFGSAGIEVASDYADAAGDYQVSGLLPGTYYAVSENDQGLIDELYDDIPCPALSCSATSGTPIVVVAGATTSGVDFALGRGGTIAGSITSAASGAPLRGIYVGVYASTGNHVGWSRPTDDAGNYETPALLPGTYLVKTMNDRSFTDELYDDIPCPGGSCSVTSGSPVVVTAGATTGGIDFALDPPPGASFYTLAPCRVIDSRLPGDPFGTALAAGEERPLSLAGRCGIPASARAVALNVTVTAPTAQGHLILYPQQRPTASTVNFEPGLTRASNAVVGLNAQGGALAWFGPPGAAGTVHLVIDVAGYFE